MNLLILASWYPNTENKISGVFIREQAKALLKTSVKPIVFFPNDKTVDKGKIICNVEDGIKVYRANTDYMANSKISRINSLRITLKYLKKVVKEDSIQLIHCHVCYPVGFAALINKKLRKVPYLITEHMSYIESYADKSYNKFLLKHSYGNAETVITVSNFLLEVLKKLELVENGKVIGNVVDTSLYKVNNRHRPEKEYNILFIGLMDKSEVKGLQFFIPALSEYIKSHSNLKIRFNLVGDGIKRKDYEKMSKELGIYENCCFLGNMAKEQIPGIVEKNDFLVLPSLKETFGSVLIEAMAGGIPVLSTRCGGPNEFVKDEVGILVEPGSIKSLISGIDKMINNIDSFNSKTVRDYAINNYSYDAIGNELLSLYNSILKK